MPVFPDGFVLRPLCDVEREYFIDCMRRAVLMAVTPRERDMGDLWTDTILGIMETDLTVGGNEAFVLETDKKTKAGILWMGPSRDQYTCDTTGYILGIFLEEGFRGRGLGKTLMSAAEEWCRRRGFLSVTLNVGSGNENARMFYDHSGFMERSTVMRKDLR